MGASVSQRQGEEGERAGKGRQKSDVAHLSASANWEAYGTLIFAAHSMPHIGVFGASSALTVLPCIHFMHSFGKSWALTSSGTSSCVPRSVFPRLCPRVLAAPPALQEEKQVVKQQA